MIKKMFILCLMLTAIIVLFSVDTLAIYDPGLNEGGLGHSINLITSDTITIGNVETDHPVLSSNFRNSMPIVQTSPRTSATYVTEGSSFEEYYTDFQLNYSNNQAVSGVKGPLSASAELAFSTQAGVSYSSYGSQYFYTLSYRDSRYALQILNNKTNRTQFKNNLDILYLNALSDTINGYQTWDWFFDVYGTHLIVSAEYGARADASYVAYSNSITFSADMKTQLSSKIGAGLAGVVGGSSSSSIDLQSINYISSGDILHNFFVKAAGGNSFSTTDYSVFQSSYNSWINSINENTSTLVDVPYDGLIPLWEILPTYLAGYSNLMKAEYEARALGKYNDMVEIFENGPIYATEFIKIRSLEKKITDDGRFDQIYDTVSLINQNINFDTLESNDYANVYIDIKFMVREQDDGYQYFFIFKNSQESNDSLIQMTPFEYYPNERKRVYEERFFSLDAIPISEFNASSFVIRWGASGNYEDDWYNYDVYVRVSVTK